MILTAAAAALASLVLVTPSGAAIVGADSHGFEVRTSIDLPVPPAQALATFAQIGSWWSKDHSYSGNAARLSLDLRPGGCWCEALDGGGGVEHMRVVFLEPGKRIVLTGGLGPLLFEATSGVMDVRAVKAPGGSTLSINYRVAGFARGNGTEMAVAVDQVIRTQAERLKAAASKKR